MLLDTELILSDSQAVTANAASTNLIDLGAARDIGSGRNLYVFATVTTALNDSSTNSTCTVTLETDSASNFASATSIQTIGTFAAQAPAGTTLAARLNPIATPEQYLRGYYTMAGGDLNAGNITLTITDDVDKWRAYANGHTIS